MSAKILPLKPVREIRVYSDFYGWRAILYVRGKRRRQYGTFVDQASAEAAARRAAERIYRVDRGSTALKVITFDVVSSEGAS